MIIRVSPRATIVEDPDDFSRFDVENEAGRGIGEALVFSGAGRLVGPDHAAIGIPFVEAAVGDRADDPMWQAGFAAMCRFAAENAWLLDDGAAIRSHIRPSERTAPAHWVAPELGWSMVPAPADCDESGLLVLLPALGTTAPLWSPVVRDLARRRALVRILHVDLPGHGSSAPAREPFTIHDLASAVIDIIDEVGGGRFWLAGNSTGGCIALETALGWSDRVRGMALFCTAARVGTPDHWVERAQRVRDGGVAALREGNRARWFAHDPLEPSVVGRMEAMLAALEDVDAESYVLGLDAVRLFDRSRDLSGLRTPTVVVAGGADTVVPAARVHALADALPLADFVEFVDVGHLAPLERPAQTAQLIAELVGVD